ncbi:multi-sensor signal transduction histidine kinase [Methylocella silvestris BL2]|uniref:histidine kinase n=1 Tax=Methylocella silvestris (strain DSM 15510 / CIP 108128 / LMG 27833 / NCIMB 13906 / BL2) TaxID=395965 RepID=B8EJU8_METSB|nr:multi-sensor signal transduction histidine kinase [Methylocella silvestris BL2]
MRDRLEAPKNQGASRSQRRFTVRYGPAVVILVLLIALGSFLIFAGFTPVPPSDAVLLGLLIANVVGIFVVLCFILIEAYSLFRARRAGVAGAQLHIQIVALFSIVAAAPALLMAWVGSVTLERSLNPGFMHDGRAFVQTTIDAARLFREAQCKSLLQEARLTASDLDRAKLMFEVDRPLFRDFFTSRTRFLGFTAAALMKPDGSVIEKIETGSAIGTTIVRPEPADFDDAKKNEPLCLILDEGRTFAAVRAMISFENTFLYVARPVDPFTVEFPRQAARLVTLYDAFDSHRRSIQIAFATMFILIALIMLLSATWLGLSFANRLVAPIRRLIAATDQVSSGNLNVQVAVRKSEGDLAHLGETFNKMTSELRLQQNRLIAASSLIDERRLFTEAVLSGVPVAVVSVGSKGEITVLNPSAARLVQPDGEGAKSILGQPLDNVLPEIREVFAEARAGQSRMAPAEISIVRGGLERLFSVSITTVPTGRGGRSYIVTLDDITDLVSAQRTAAWADVARRIAHEIRNPLTPIQLSAERLKRKYGRLITQDRDIFDQCTDTIIRQVDDIKRMVDEFSSFARMPKPRVENNDLGECVRRVLFLMRVAHPNIIFEDSLPEEPVHGRFDRRLLSQALTNIVKNATEGIEAEVAASGPFEGHIGVALSVSEDMVVIDVVDNGKGFPKDNRQRLLEPYMTTRAEGTGLGLPIVAKILADHGGGLELRDAPRGRGAWVRLFFPLDQATPDQADASSEVVTATATQDS